MSLATGTWHAPGLPLHGASADVRGHDRDESGQAWAYVGANRVVVPACVGRLPNPTETEQIREVSVGAREQNPAMQANPPVAARPHPTHPPGPGLPMGLSAAPGQPPVPPKAALSPVDLPPTGLHPVDMPPKGLSPVDLYPGMGSQQPPPGPKYPPPGPKYPPPVPPFPPGQYPTPPDGGDTMSPCCWSESEQRLRAPGKWFDGQTGPVVFRGILPAGPLAGSEVVYVHVGHTRVCATVCDKKAAKNPCGCRRRPNPEPRPTPSRAPRLPKPLKKPAGTRKPNPAPRRRSRTPAAYDLGQLKYQRLAGMR